MPEVITQLSRTRMSPLLLAFHSSLDVSQPSQGNITFLGDVFQTPSPLGSHKLSLQAGNGLSLAVHTIQPVLQLVHMDTSEHVHIGCCALAFNPALLLCPPQVSQAAADLLAYCEAHVREDPLIIPVPASENPFREKKFFCTIL